MKRSLMGVLAAAVLAGCSSGSSGQPERIRGAPKEVAETVARLDAATRARRFDTVCTTLFTATARRRAGGRDCAALLRSAAGDVRRPSIRLLSIEMRGDRARARLRTRAASQPAVDETVELVRDGGRYRIQSLSP